MHANPCPQACYLTAHCAYWSLLVLVQLLLCLLLPSTLRLGSPQLLYRSQLTLKSPSSELKDPRALDKYPESSKSLADLCGSYPVRCWVTRR